MQGALASAGCLLIANMCAIAGSLAPAEALRIPAVTSFTQRSITIEDMLNIRRIDTLRISHDGRRFAIFVRQNDVPTNGFRTAWYCGNVDDGHLTHIGDGGEMALRIEPNGSSTGPLQAHVARWSPDGEWVAYTRREQNEVQLWRSKCDGTAQEQLTRNASDVIEFAWRRDGKALYYSAGAPRAELLGREEAKARRGYRLDDELLSFVDFMRPQVPRLPEDEKEVWSVTLDDGRECKAGKAEQAEFELAKSADAAGDESLRADGARAWLKASDVNGLQLRVVASLPSRHDSVITCDVSECSGAIKALWWSDDGERIIFWKGEGVLDAQHAFYGWSPATGKVESLLRLTDDYLENCAKVTGERLICVRETPTRPVHLAAVSLRTGTVSVVAGVNPEFDNIRLGKAQRFEWTLPKYPWGEPGGALEGVYPDKAFGYILYPPEFDATKKYPVFVEPYAAFGFDRQVQAEHALHVYAANGFVVLKTQFPFPTAVGLDKLGARTMKQLYSAELGFPHLTLLGDSTLRALDMVGRQGFIDLNRVGIGGVSHGSFVPLYMMQRYDRIAAISLSSGVLDAIGGYYGPSRRSRALRDFDDWAPNPQESAGRAFWRQLQAADHVEELEAPILMNLSPTESLYLIRLIRELGDAGRPYDAYIFPKETHLKWQPAHLAAIMHRNLDWFRFWLQGSEDSSPEKREQYALWHELKKLQCRNPRSLLPCND